MELHYPYWDSKAHPALKVSSYAARLESLVDEAKEDTEYWFDFATQLLVAHQQDNRLALGVIEGIAEKSDVVQERIREIKDAAGKGGHGRAWSS